MVVKYKNVLNLIRPYAFYSVELYELNINENKYRFRMCIFRFIHGRAPRPNLVPPKKKETTEEKVWEPRVVTNVRRRRTRDSKSKQITSGPGPENRPVSLRTNMVSSTPLFDTSGSPQ